MVAHDDQVLGKVQADGFAGPWVPDDEGGERKGSRAGGRGRYGDRGRGEQREGHDHCRKSQFPQ